MAHLYLETTADLPENADIPDILEALCVELVAKHQVDTVKIRACHTLRSVWYVGAGAPPAFVHLAMYVLEGRDLEWKQAAGRALTEVLRERFSMSLGDDEASITVDIREMPRETFIRYP